MQVRTQLRQNQRTWDRPLAVILCLLAVHSSVHAADKPLPKFKDIAAIFQAQLDKQKGWKPGHIISRRPIEAAFDLATKQGWDVADQQALLNRIPNDDDFLVKELNSSAGRKFMDQIAKYPLAYDRLERLAGIPRGRDMVHDLIHDKGGYKMIEYMTTTDGGKNMGKMLGKTAQGVDFNKPTGKLYTWVALEEQLKKSYQSAQTTQK